MANIQPANIFGSDNVLCIMANADLCQTFGSPRTSYVPTGSGLSLNFGVTGKSQMNQLAVGTGDPVQVIGATYTGAVGTYTIEYEFTLQGPSGQQGAINPAAISIGGVIQNAVYPLGAGNSATFPCAGSLQAGAPAGYIYIVHAQEQTTFQTRNLGTCALGTNVTDSGGGTAEPGYPIFPGNSQMTVGSILMHPTANAIQKATSIFNLAPETGISLQPAGIVTVDTGTAGNGLGTLKAASIIGPGTSFMIGSGTASNTDGVGELTLAAATTISYTWQNLTYVSHPEVNLTPQFDIGSGVRMWVTYTGTTSFTINFSAVVTGTVGYISSARN
jgi:hypothetical protein